MKEIFCNDQVVQEFDKLKQVIVLKEEDTNQSIIIGGIPSDSILIKLDVNKRAYKRRSMYLRREASFIHQGCDYCLIIPSKHLIVFFELKSLKPRERKYVEQFIASEIFINYCRNLANYFNNTYIDYEIKRILLSPKYNYGLTSNKEIINISTVDKNGKNIEIKTPGFPSQIRLEKLI